MVDAAGDLAPRARRTRSQAARESLEVVVRELSPAWLSRYEAFASSNPHAPAQSPVWLRAWHEHGGRDTIALTVEENGEPMLMAVLEVVPKGPFRVARFVGGSHANANLPAASPEWSRRAGLSGVKAIATGVRAARPDIDLLLFERMVASDGEAPNPLLAAGGAASPNLALSLPLGATMAATLEGVGDRRKAKKHRSKQRKFEEAGGCRHIEASTPEEVERLLTAFFHFKEGRFRAAGIPDVFADASVRAALNALYTRSLAEPTRPFVLNGLEVGGTLRAVTGSSRTPSRTTCDFVGISNDELSRQSPGEFLFYENISAASLAGQGFYDFGIGDEPYKRHWCTIETAHFDVELPLTAKGRALSAWSGALRRVKTTVKRNPRLWAAIRGLRRSGAGRTMDEGEAE